jgi:hypothetical protein
MGDTKWLLQELEQTKYNLKEVVDELLLSEKEVFTTCCNIYN